MSLSSEEVKKFKLIFLGDQGVGKSSILNRYAQDKFDEEYQATVGLDFHSKNEVIGGNNIRLLLYDTAGQEKFKSLIPMYIRDANVIIIVYDISKKLTFDHTSIWFDETSDLKRADAIFCLVGNKSDLESSREVSLEEGQKLAEEKDFIFSEVSAKTGDHIQEFFINQIFPKMEQKFNLNQTTPDDNTNDTANNTKIVDMNKVELSNQTAPQPKQKKGCCGGGKKNKK